MPACESRVDERHSCSTVTEQRQIYGWGQLQREMNRLQLYAEAQSPSRSASQQPSRPPRPQPHFESPRPALQNSNDNAERRLTERDLAEVDVLQQGAIEVAVSPAQRSADQRAAGRGWGDETHWSCSMAGSGMATSRWVTSIGTLGWERQAAFQG